MEIVNTYTETTSFLFPAILTFIMVFFGIMAIITAIQRREIIGMFFGLIVCAGIIFGIVCLSIPPTTTVYYEVIVSDYNTIDFEKYEIVKHKGKIVVLKELPQEG